MLSSLLVIVIRALSKLASLNSCKFVWAYWKYMSLSACSRMTTVFPLSKASSWLLERHRMYNTLSTSPHIRALPSPGSCASTTRSKVDRTLISLSQFPAARLSLTDFLRALASLSLSTGNRSSWVKVAGMLCFRTRIACCKLNSGQTSFLVCSRLGWA